MHTHQSDQPTDKSQGTRQRIQLAAKRLFKECGYNETTMRDIAAAAQCSPGSVYRYFATKEDLAERLYDELTEEAIIHIETLPFASLAERYRAALAFRLEQIQPYRGMVAALYAAAMRPNSDVEALNGSDNALRQRAIAAFIMLVTASSDRPRGEVATSMGVLMYTFHLLLILFWLYDRTPQHRATHLLLAFLGEMFKMLRPMMLMPVVNRAIIKLAEVVTMVFGGTITEMPS